MRSIIKSDYHPNDIQMFRSNAMLLYIPFVCIVLYTYMWVSKFGRRNMKISAILMGLRILTLIGIFICPHIMKIFLYIVLIILYIITFGCMILCKRGKTL